MKSQGHLDDSSDNRKILMELANDVKAMLEKTHTIITGIIKNQKTGSQLWVSSRYEVIQDGGINNPPRT